MPVTRKTSRPARHRPCRTRERPCRTEHGAWGVEPVGHDTSDVRLTNNPGPRPTVSSIAIITLVIWSRYRDRQDGCKVCQREQRLCQTGHTGSARWTEAGYNGTQTLQDEAAALYGGVTIRVRQTISFGLRPVVHGSWENGTELGQASTYCSLDMHPI